MFRPAAQQIHVGVIHPDDEAAAREVIRRVSADLIVHGETARGVVRGKAQAVISLAPFNHACLFPEPDEIPLRRGARRLQAQQHACGLDQGCLPLRIAADENRARRMQIKPGLLEAAKIAHCQLGQHF